MDLKVAIYRHVLEPKYIKIYQYIEEMSRTSRLSITRSHRKDIVNILADVIAIKEKYGIDYSEDLELLQKYNN
jgi:hypothetical protein